MLLAMLAVSTQNLVIMAIVLFFVSGVGWYPWPGRPAYLAPVAPIFGVLFVITVVLLFCRFLGLL
jgi:hypothetical protein